MARLARFGSELAQDLRYAGRSLSGSRGFALAAIVTISLGVGVNTGIFSVLNAVAFRDVPAAEPDELDPYALVGAAAAVLGAAFLASAIPARRAMSVDPMAALRYE